MRIGFVPHAPLSFIKGGTEIQAIKTKEMIEKEGHQVLWLDVGDEEFIKKIDLIHFFASTPPHLTWWAELAKQYVPVVVSPIFYAKDVPHKLFYTFFKKLRGTTAHIRFSMIRVADILLPNSKVEARQLIRIFQVPPEKIRVIPNGVEKDFVGTNPQEFIRKYLPGWENKKFILSVQHISPVKNTINLIKAALSIQTPLVIIGSLALADSVSRKAIKYFSESYPHLFCHIPFLPRSELKNAYAAAHVFALPSHSETTGLASLEAGLNGCNLVLGKCEPVEEYFQGIAFIVKQDVNSIANGLKQALTKPRNCFNQAEFIFRNYTWEQVGKMTLQVYEELLSKKRIR